MKPTRILLILTILLYFQPLCGQQSAQLRLRQLLERIEQLEDVQSHAGFGNCTWVNIAADGLYEEQDTCSGFQIQFSLSEVDPALLSAVAVFDGEATAITFYCKNNTSCIRVLNERKKTRYYSSFEAFYLNRQTADAADSIVSNFIKINELLVLSRKRPQ